MSAERPSSRVLWNDRKTVLVFILALLVTAAIIGLQLGLRRGEFDPSALRIYYRLYLFQDYPAAVLMLCALGLAMLPPVQAAGERCARIVGSRPLGAVLAAFVALLLLSRFAYLAHPLAMDESVPVMQSEIFAAGRLLGYFPPALIDWLVMPSFQGHFVKVSHDTGAIASSYWPGFALLLTPFSLIGAPWLLNPLLGASALYVVHVLARRLTGSATGAGFAVLLAFGSAAFVVNAISFYSMTAHLLCNAAFVLLLLQPSPARAFGAGLVGGLALTLHNPLPHLLFGAPWVLWLACRADRRRTLLPLLGGYLPWVAIGGVGWFVLQGSLGSAGSGSTAAESSVLHQVTNLARNVLSPPSLAVLHARFIDLTKLWIWAAPALLLLAGIGGWSRRRELPYVLLASSAVLTLLGYLFVPVDQGHGWGHRYFHSAWFVLPLLAAGIARGSDQESSAGEFEGSTAGVARFGMAGALTGTVLVVPFLLFKVHGFISDHLAQLPESRNGTARVVIINPFGAYYAQDLAQNDPFLRDPVIRMVTRGRQADREMIARQFPDLVLLESDYRGWVWGHAEGAAVPPEASGLGRISSEDQRQQE